MEKHNYINFIHFKMIFFLNFIIQTLSQESCNNLLKTNKCFSNYCTLNPNKKECFVNNILIIENTNGDIYLNKDFNSKVMMFGTTLSNNEDRIFYGIFYTELISYYFNYDDDSLPLIINIGRSERKEIKNAELAFLNYRSEYIFLFGSDNSFIEIYHAYKKNNRLLYEPTNFLEEDIIIKGNPSLFKFIDSKFYFTVITSTEEKSTFYNISFYEYNLYFNIQNNITMTLINKNHFETKIKGENMSCDLIKGNSLPNLNLISCFYLTEDNNYTIILVNNSNNEFIMKNKIVVEQKEDFNMEKPYFIKVILFNLDFCVYAYYSGELSDIPTFLIKTLSKPDYSINDKFVNFTVVYLYDYKFNNEIKYNDLVTNKNDEFYFISTDKDKENIIISYIIFYSKDNKEQLLIRYYTIPLKQNYNMKIFNGLKAIYFNIDNEGYMPFLTLGFDFFFNEESSKSNNAGLIIFSFPNVLTDDKFDFIEYAFKYNINYIIMNFTDIFGIQNNIYGYSIDFFIFYIEDDNIEIQRINGTKIKSKIASDNPIVKVILNDNIYKLTNIIITVYIYFSPPDTIEKFNEHCNKINETFGNKIDESSFSLDPEQKVSHNIEYNILINKELSNECSISDCDLCLKSDPNYCIVCKDDNYSIIEDIKYPYGKLKICSEKKSDIITNEIADDITDELTNKKTDEVTNEISGKITNEIADELTNKKTIEIINEITSRITNKITDEKTEKKTDEITNKITDEITEKKTDKITNKITNEITEKKTDEITNDILNQITNKIITDKITNEITNKIITDKRTDEITIETTDDLTNKITNEITIGTTNEIKEILTNSISEKITNKDTEEIINTLTDKLTNEITERLSNEKTKETIIELTEKLTSELTEMFDEKTELITNEYIREITDKITEKLTNKVNTNYITSNIDTENISNDLANLIKTNRISNKSEISFEELLNNKYKNVTLSIEEIEEIYKHIKDYITKNYDGNNTIINTSNVKIQISKIDDQKDSELSNIDLGACEEILKNKYCKTENDSLIMLKFDIRPENETSTFVHYEVYSTSKKIYLEMEECSGNNVIINVPIELSSEIEEIYEFLSKSGYNIFDSNNTFYNDICASFTTQNGTDILLYDRRMDIYRTTLNISLCQEGCDFLSYSIETKKAKCDCYSQKNDLSIEDLSEIKFDKNQMIDDFYQTIQNSNFRVLKCYELVFNIKIFIRNIGSIGMLVLLAIFNILIIIHLALGSKKINSFIQIIIKRKYLENENKSSKNSNKQIKSKKDKKKDNNNKNKNNKKKRFSVIYNKNLSLEKTRDIKRKKTSINLDNKNEPPKRKNSKYKKNNDEGNKTNERFLSNKKSSNYNLISSKMMTLNLNEKKANDLEITPKVRRNSKHKKNSKKLKNDLTVYHNHKDCKDCKDEKTRLNHKRSTAIYIPKRRKSKKITKKMKNLLSFSKDEETSTRLKNKTLAKNDLGNIEKVNDLNTQELNSLKYEEALELDKRTYFQYYFSLLKKKTFNSFYIFTYK